jgi:DhnA family fructose-bisphosphate aldolase class Ia
MDHGMFDGPCKGLESPGKTITKIVDGGADAVLTTYGVAHRFAQELAPVGLILRADGGTTSIGMGEGPSSIFFGVEAALRLGADALAVSAFPGAPNEAATLENLANMIDAAHAWGLPVLAEMVPGGFDSAPEYRTQENIALSARVGAELGADFVKIPYVAGFEAVTSTCYGRGQAG